MTELTKGTYKIEFFEPRFHDGVVINVTDTEEGEELRDSVKPLTFVEKYLFRFSFQDKVEACVERLVDVLERRRKKTKEWDRMASEITNKINK